MHGDAIGVVSMLGELWNIFAVISNILSGGGEIVELQLE